MAVEVEIKESVDGKHVLVPTEKKTYYRSGYVSGEDRYIYFNDSGYWGLNAKEIIAVLLVM